MWGIINTMYIKEKKIDKNKYKYAVKSIRLPDGKIAKLEKIYKNQSKNELENFFKEKEKEEYLKYSLKNFKTNNIFTKEEFKKIESIKADYKNIIKRLTKTSLKDLLDRFTANFTYESNALEGNSLTLKDVAMIMFENKVVENKDLREIYETRNSRKVVEMIMKNKLTISHKDIIKMHKILIRDTDIQQGYKKFPNVIIGKKIKTTPPEKVYEEMQKLIEFYKKNPKKLHPIELASTFHGQFEKIHPFEDGNGRVGRFLINIILIENKYPPLIIRKSQRLKYIKSLENFDAGREEYLKRFILQRFKETYKKFFDIYIKYI